MEDSKRRTVKKNTGIMHGKWYICTKPTSSRTQNK